MNVLAVFAALLTVRLVVAFFGPIADSSAGEAYLRISGVLALPLGLPQFRSLYGGVFDVDTALMVIICLVAEWRLAAWRAVAVGKG